MGRQGNSRHWAISGQDNVQFEEAGTPKEPQIGVMESRAQGHSRYHPSIRLMKDEVWGVFLNSASDSLSRHGGPEGFQPLRLSGGRVCKRSVGVSLRPRSKDNAAPQSDLSFQLLLPP